MPLVLILQFIPLILIRFIGGQMASMLLQGTGAAPGSDETMWDAGLAGQLDDMVYVIDGSTGRFTGVNRAAERLTGYGRDIFTASTFEEWSGAGMHPGDQKNYVRRMKELTGQGEGGRAETLRMDYRMIDSDGATHWVTDTVSRVPGAGPPAYRGTVRDVTPVRTMRDDLRRRNLELELITGISRRIQADESPEKLSAGLLGALLDGTGFDAGALWHRDVSKGGDHTLMAAVPSQGPFSDRTLLEFIGDPGKTSYRTIGGPDGSGPEEAGRSPVAENRRVSSLRMAAS